MQFNNLKRNINGFTLVEAVVSVAVFAVVTVALYAGYTQALQVVRLARLKAQAVSLANEQFEIIRNLPYSDVGIVNGIPSGKITRFQTLIRDGITFNATTTIRNDEDPFDGLATGTTPVDTAPADYKLVALEIGCTGCAPHFQPMEFTTTVAPKGLETSSTNGSLFVKVFDSSGVALSDVTVNIKNPSTTPTIDITDNTDVNGMLEIVDTPPGTQNYRISVSKTGYSSDRTYALKSFGTSTIVNPDKTVALQKVTQASFAIDRTSTLTFNTLSSACVPVGSVSYSIVGNKLVATSPSVNKYSATRSTDSSGSDVVSGLEWDTYSVQSLANAYFVSGTIPLLPLSIQPNSSSNLSFILSGKNPSALLVTVKDASTGLPISDAAVNLSKSGFSDDRTTGQGYWRQTDWSGGAGQSSWAAEDKYASSDGNISVSTAGSIKLATLFGNYVTDGYLISSTYDAATTSNFYTLTWQPLSQPSQAGSSAVRFQLASNNDNATWNFIGPDGTAATYYTSANQTISVAHNGNRYIRYKVFLHTDNITYTPTISDIAITYNSQCSPPGQVYFDGLSSGTYTLSVTKTGYQNNTSSVTVPSNGYASTSVMMSL